ncbi:MAG: Na/Pi cotransporter family protein [Clostridiales bacterium]|nr:Na/Pi cotransporter family protein [Clostridiales bacterium]
MDLFNILTMIGGLALFLFGLSVMGTGLEKSAGNRLKSLLGKMTTTKWNGFLLGLGVTAIIQSSSATTVIVVGFVNSSIMSLKQAINIIMGANVGTTVTSWLLSLSGLEGDNIFVKMFKPTSFTPILALIGIIFFMFLKNQKKKDIGMILLGFSVLIFGMDAMSTAVKPLAEVEAFRNILLMFSNPFLGVLAGAVLTGIIQSSSASVGILQALSATGQVTIGSAIPIIMGQNIGTCVTALISSVGTNKNARRAAFVHLYFNIIGTLIFLILFTILNSVFKFAFVSLAANQFIIAVVHTSFNILSTALLFPFGGLLEKLAYKTVKDNDKEDKSILLDTRLFSTPSIAINRSRTVTGEMADIVRDCMRQAMDILFDYREDVATQVREAEAKTDMYEDMLGTYLVKLSGHSMAIEDSTEAAKLLYLIGEFERISDYAVNVVNSSLEMYEKKMQFSQPAQNELKTMMLAVDEIIAISFASFKENDIRLAASAEPLEQVIDDLKSRLKKNHISRLQCNECTIEMGFVFSDLITVLERTADHCSNIAGCVIEMSHKSMDMHDYFDKLKRQPDDNYIRQYNEYLKKYSIGV